MFYAVHEIRKARLAIKWPKIPARVVRSRRITTVDNVEAGEVTYFQPQVLFEYQYQGQTLRSVNLCLDSDAYRFTGYEKAHAILKKFPENQDIEISCSEAGDVVLLADINSERKQHYAAWFLLGLFIAMVTPLMLWNAS
jgi:Protein of unknown function (DUF3592)